jgi:hypothetical protein
VGSIYQMHTHLAPLCVLLRRVELTFPSRCDPDPIHQPPIPYTLTHTHTHTHTLHGRRRPPPSSLSLPARHSSREWWDAILNSAVVNLLAKNHLAAPCCPTQPPTNPPPAKAPAGCNGACGVAGAGANAGAVHPVLAVPFWCTMTSHEERGGQHGSIHPGWPCLVGPNDVIGRGGEMRLGGSIPSSAGRAWSVHNDVIGRGGEMRLGGSIPSSAGRAWCTMPSYEERC